MLRAAVWSVSLTLSVIAASGCAPTSKQQAAAFTPSTASLEARSYQSRRFDTGDQTLMIEAALGALQDMGFTIEETQARYGVIVASKLGGGRIRGEVVLRPSADRSGTVVRATFQEFVSGPGAMLGYGANLKDPQLYQGFFEKLSQSAFLTAHGI